VCWPAETVIVAAERRCRTSAFPRTWRDRQAAADRAVLELQEADGLRAV